MVCRMCSKADETLFHIVNCGQEEEVDTSIVYDDHQYISYEKRLRLSTIASRIDRFLDEVKERKEDGTNR